MFWEAMSASGYSVQAFRSSRTHGGSAWTLLAALHPPQPDSVDGCVPVMAQNSPADRPRVRRADFVAGVMR